MKKLDKKQIPQFAALCVLTAGVSGYLVLHLAAPGKVSAGTRIAAPTPAAPASTLAAPAVAASGAASASAGVKPGDAKIGDTKIGDAKIGDAKIGSASLAEAAVPGDAPPPTPAMHDPFAVGYVAPTGPAAAAKPPTSSTLPNMQLPHMPNMQTPNMKLPGLKPPKQLASAFGPMPVSFPGAPALPAGLSSFPMQPGGTRSGGMAGPLPSAPPAPALPVGPPVPIGPPAPLWTVTGVLQGAAGKVAILRSGDARRIVQSGDFVDGTYRVAGVTRTDVLLRHGTLFYKLMLGGAKAVPTKMRIAKPTSAKPMHVQPSAVFHVPKQPAVMDSAIIPVYHTARPQAALTHLYRQGPGLNLAAQKLSVPHPSHASSQSHGGSQGRSASPAKVASDIALGLRLLDGSVPAQSR